MQEELCLLKEAIKNGRKWSQISKFLKGRNENAVKNHFFSILKITSKEKISEEEISRKIYLKIKNIQDKLSIDHPLPHSFQPITIKTKHEISLTNMSLSNSSFRMMQHHHKRLKIIESPLMERYQRPSSKHLDNNNSFNSKGILIEPNFSSIVLGNDLMKDEGQMNLCQMFENSLGFAENNNGFINSFINIAPNPHYRDLSKENLSKENLSKENLSKDNISKEILQKNNFNEELLQNLSPHEFQGILSGNFSKLLDYEEQDGVRKQMSSVSSMQNTNSKISWLNNILNPHKLSSNSLFKIPDSSQKSLIFRNIEGNSNFSPSNFSPSSFRDCKEVRKARESLFAMASEVGGSFNILLNLSNQKSNNE